MAGSGFASKFNFRKSMSDRAMKPKYEHTVKLTEELEAEALEAQVATQIVEQPMEEDNDKTNEKEAEYSMTDLMSGMDKQMRLEKNKGGFKQVQTKEQKLKAIRKK